MPEILGACHDRASAPVLVRLTRLDALTRKKWGIWPDLSSPAGRLIQKFALHIYTAFPEAGNRGRNRTIADIAAAAAASIKKKISKPQLACTQAIIGIAVALTEKEMMYRAANARLRH